MVREPSKRSLMTSASFGVASSIVLVLGIIVVLCFAVVIAGLGYFSPGGDD